MYIILNQHIILLNWVRGSTKAYVNKNELAYQSSVETLKTSVSSGKAAIASAVTDKDVQTAADATFDTMAQNIRSIASAPQFVGIGKFTIYYGSSTIPTTKPADYSSSTFTFDVSTDLNPATDTPFDIYVQNIILLNIDTYNRQSPQWFAYHNNKPYVKIGNQVVILERIVNQTYNYKVYVEFAAEPPVITGITNTAYSSQGSDYPEYEAKKVSIRAKTKVWKDNTYAGSTSDILTQIFLNK